MQQKHRYSHLIGDTPITELYLPEEQERGAHELGKAGLLPFYQHPDGTIEVYLMCPKASRPELGPPKFQIAKGTRMIRDAGKSRDVQASDFPLEDLSRTEDLLATALREGAEEIGLRTENLVKIYVAKSFIFSSASSGNERYMMLYAGLVHDREAFDAPDSFTAKTATCQWMTLEECKEQAREDHLAIIEEIYGRMKHAQAFTSLAKLQDGRQR